MHLLTLQPERFEHWMKADPIEIISEIETIHNFKPSSNSYTIFNIKELPLRQAKHTDDVHFIIHNDPSGIGHVAIRFINLPDYTSINTLLKVFQAYLQRFEAVYVSHFSGTFIGVEKTLPEYAKF